MARAPAYLITIDGRDITPRLGGRLLGLTLTESRGDEADQLDLALDDSDHRLALPPAGARIALRLGWAGEPLVDKGLFTVDEVEHSGAPDQVQIRARSADLHRALRQRASASWHATTLGAIVADLAAAGGLQAAIDPALAALAVAHVDQTNESALNFLTRLARRHDAVATVKKGQLIFRAISASGLAPVTITRALGDAHRWHQAQRTSYAAVRASWHDLQSGQERSVVVGTPGATDPAAPPGALPDALLDEDGAGGEKRLKDLYDSEDAARRAATAELARIQRGAATLELTLAEGRPQLMPQSPARVTGFKPQIDGTQWLVVTVTHAIADGSGYTTRVELERAAG